jgi:hypothetical protein
MRKLQNVLFAFIAICLFHTAFGQNVIITGVVTNANSKETISSVSVVIKGSDAGTYTDDRGSFSITTKTPLPITLVFTSIGFESTEVVVSKANTPVILSLNPGSSLGQEVVVSATRTPSRILESPVSIERISNATIRNSSAANYYDIVTNLKGVDVVTSSPLNRPLHGDLAEVVTPGFYR